MTASPPAIPDPSTPPTTPAAAPRWQRSSFRLLVRLLGGGGRDEMAEWRGWVRWVWWSEHRTAKSKVRALATAAATPVTALVEAASAARRLGPTVHRVSGVRPFSLFAAQYALRLRYGIGPATYYGCQLYRPDRRGRARSFVDQHDTEILQRRLLRGGVRGTAAMFTNKRRFADWCAEHGFPSVAAVLEFEKGEVARSRLVDGELPADDLFVKPASEAGGRGAERWRHLGDRRWRGSGGATLDQEALLARLSDQSREMRGGLLVQRFLRNHPAVADLTPGGLCTMRMVTIRPVDGGAPRLLLTVYRMPVGDSAADNFGGGGVAAAVDLETGRLGDAWQREPAARQVVRPVERHPDTGATIAGTIVPAWHEAAALVVRAHAAAPGIAPAIGWDVAILPDGPVLVEGNNVPGAPVSQMATGVGYGEGPYVPLLIDYLRARIR